MSLVSVLGSQATGGTNIVSIVVLYAAIIGIFWFFAIRPQKKKQKNMILWYHLWKQATAF